MVADWAGRNLKLLPVILLAVTLAVVGSFLVVAKTTQEPPPSEADRISDVGTLLVVMQPGCDACTHFEERVAPGYKQTTQSNIAPVRYIDINDVQRQKTYRLKTGIRGTPTLLMIDGFGQEIGRSLGSPPTSAGLANLVDRYAARMTRKGI